MSPDTLTEAGQEAVADAKARRHSEQQVARFSAKMMGEKD